MTSLQLAGHALGTDPEDYPFFERVASFQTNESVEVTVDPSLVPGIMNKTCRIYVVDDKSKSEWMACPRPSLVDRTPDGYLLTTFSGTSVQQNVKLVAAAEDLSARSEPCYTVTIDGAPTERCIGVGKAYDVVLDCDQDETLSFGDFADGFSTPYAGDSVDAAGMFVVPDTAQPSLPTSCVDYTTDINPGFSRQRLYVPSNYASIANRLPLVVISHGNNEDSAGVYAKWNGLQNHLASYGYVVMAHQNDVDNEFPLTWGESTIAHTDGLLDILAENAVACAARLAGVTPCGSSTFDPCSLHDRIDASRIVWIGHSRGGNGVVWARELLALPPNDPNRIVPEHFGLGDVKLISSLAPADFTVEGYGRAKAGTTPYHMIAVGGDDDVRGAPDPADAFKGYSFALFERATGPRNSAYLHGGAHGWFFEGCAAGDSHVCQNQYPPRLPDPCCSNTGTDGIQSPGPQGVSANSLYPPLLRFYLYGAEEGRDSFWRPGERYRSPSLPSARWALDYRPPVSAMTVIDDFQSNPAIAVSSSGGAVTLGGGAAAYEGVLADEDETFDWARDALLPRASRGYFCSAGGFQQTCMTGFGTGNTELTIPCDVDFALAERQPMNGMTRAAAGDEARGLVFEWRDESPEGFLQFEVPVGARDVSGKRYLSFRLAQMPRHPLTMTLGDDVDLTVALVDNLGRVGRIRLSSTGQEVIQPYGRADGTPLVFGGVQKGTRSCSVCYAPPDCNYKMSGRGWQAEFETVRLRIADFLSDGTGLNVTRIAAIRFETGPGKSDVRGRVAIDDLAFTTE